MRTVHDVVHPAREEAALIQKRISLLYRLAVVVLGRLRRWRRWRRRHHVGIGAEPDALFIRAFEEPDDDRRERQELALPRAAARDDTDHGGFELVGPDLLDARALGHELLVVDPLHLCARVVALDRLADVEAEEVQEILVRAVLDEDLVLRRLPGADRVEQRVDPPQAVGRVVERGFPELLEIGDAAGNVAAASSKGVQILFGQSGERHVAKATRTTARSRGRFATCRESCSRNCKRCTRCAVRTGEPQATPRWPGRYAPCIRPY